VCSHLLLQSPPAWVPSAQQQTLNGNIVVNPELPAAPRLLPLIVGTGLSSVAVQGVTLGHTCKAYLESRC
jgi:hypothetical protein